MDNETLCIASYNCNGLANTMKRIKIFTWLKNKKELICLQETHSRGRKVDTRMEGAFINMYNMIEYYDNSIIMVGDFNTLLDPAKDRAGGRRDYQDQRSYAIASMISVMDLVDIWRIKNPDLSRYTGQRKSMASRIDFLISFSLLQLQNSVK